MHGMTLQCIKALQVQHCFVMWLLICVIGQNFDCWSWVFARRVTVSHSIWALPPQKWGNAIFNGYEYRLDALVQLQVMF